MAMESSPWVTLFLASYAALLLPLLTSEQSQQQKWQWQMPRVLTAVAVDSQVSGPLKRRQDHGSPMGDSIDLGFPPIAAEGGRGGDFASAFVGGDGWSGETAESDEEKVLVGDAGPFDVNTARQLVDAIKQAADVAAGAAATVEAVHKDVLVHKQECEARSRAAGEEIGISFAQLQELASSVGKASDALVEMRSMEFAKFLDAVAEAKLSQDWMAVAQRQDVLSGLVASLKKGQEETARDLQMLKSSYLSLEGNIQDQLRRVTESTAEASANNYKLLAERLREIAETRLAEIQRAHNDQRLDELAADRSISDMIQQLKKKGVAVLDVSDVFPSRGFDALRKELMVRVAKRVKAFFLPVFIVTQTQEEFSDWLYSRYHLVPSVRMIENIIEELSFINDRETYAVVRVESVLTDVIIRRAEPRVEFGVKDERDLIASSAASHEAEERHKLQVRSLTEGKVLSYISQPSQESLVVARGPFFGAEVVKRFDTLTKSYLRTMVGGHLEGRAVLIVYMGDRKGEIARPAPSLQEVIRKLDIAEKLCTSYSAPSQEVAALWRQMELEIPFYSIFFRVDPVVFDTIPVSFSFEQAKLPPLPPSPLFRGEFGVVQIQALLKKDWHIPSSRALQSVISYVNRHTARGGVQAIVSVVEENVTGFWRSKARYTVKVTVRSADAPPMRLRLALAQTSANRPALSEAKGEVLVVSVAGQEAVQQYFTQSVAKARGRRRIAENESFLVASVCSSGRWCGRACPRLRFVIDPICCGVAGGAKIAAIRLYSFTPHTRDVRPITAPHLRFRFNRCFPVPSKTCLWLRSLIWPLRGGEMPQHRNGGSEDEHEYAVVASADIASEQMARSLSGFNHNQLVLPQIVVGATDKGSVYHTPGGTLVFEGYEWGHKSRGRLKQRDTQPLLRVCGSRRVDAQGWDVQELLVSVNLSYGC
ncbi:hypothetical protein Esti_003102 [Eimeria stiedai]